MQIELKTVDKNLDFEHGDILVTESEDMILVVKDPSWGEYVSISLNNLQVGYRCNKKENLLQFVTEDYGRVVRVVKSKNLKLIEI